MTRAQQGWGRSMAAGDFEVYKRFLEVIYTLSGRGKALDLGVGEGHVTRHWDADYVDLVIRETAPAKTMKFDIRDAPKRLAQFHYNLCVMTDVVEHLRPLDLNILLASLHYLCDATVIFTPSGPYRLKPESEHPDDHKSAWWPEQFYLAGWEVFEWPTYHRFPNGEILGAFFAWKFNAYDRETPDWQTVSSMAGIL